MNIISTKKLPQAASRISNYGAISSLGSHYCPKGKVLGHMSQTGMSNATRKFSQVKFAFRFWRRRVGVNTGGWDPACI